jgi:hypothetical protein
MSGGGSSTSTQDIPWELKPLAAAYGQRAMQIGSNPFQAYTGQRFAGLNPTESAGINMIQQRALNGSPIQNQANDTLMQTLQGGQTNPYLDSMVGKAQQNLVQNYNNVIRPQQNALQAQSGSFGNTGVMQSIGQQQNQLEQNLGDISTQMYGQAYDQDRARQMQALGMAPDYANQQYNDAKQLLGAGALQQQNDQQNLDFNYQQFQDAQNQPYKNLAAMGSPFGQNMGGSSTTKTSQDNTAQYLASAGMLAAAFLSDRRAKTDIKKVGKTDDGLNVYTYRYKSGGPMQMGVMAQEVQKKTPDAVVPMGQGLLGVDYSKVQ